MTLSKCLNYFFGVSLLSMILIYHSRIIAVAWYISAMLLAMMRLYPIGLKYKRNFIYVYSLIIALFIYGFIDKMDKSIAGADILYFIFFAKNLLRAIAGISLGCFAFVIVENFKKINIV